MSNAIARKKKKMQPQGYKDDIHVFNQQKVRMMNYATELAEKTFSDIKLVAFNVLHDKFGYGQKRLIMLEEKVNKLMEGNTSCEELAVFLQKKGIDLMEVDIPQRDLMGFQDIAYNNNILPLKNKVNVVLGAVSDFIVLSATSLMEMKLSKRQLMEYVDWIRYYINSLSQKYLDMIDVASVLYHECNYCDIRFVGKFREI